MRFAADNSFDDDLADALLRSAIERQLDIVGEALNPLKKVVPDNATLVPDLPRAVARTTFDCCVPYRHGSSVWGVFEQHLNGMQ